MSVHAQAILRGHHTCPGSGCAQRVPSHMLMCRGHWYQVPSHLQAAVYRAWQRGRGAGTAEHFGACVEAIEAIGGDSGPWRRGLEAVSGGA